MFDLSNVCIQLCKKQNLQCRWQWLELISWMFLVSIRFLFVCSTDCWSWKCLQGGSAVGQPCGGPESVPGGYFSTVLGRRQGGRVVILCCVKAACTAQVCIFTVEFIKESSHFPFNLQPYVNKLLAGFSSVIKNKTLPCLDWLLVALPLQNQRKRVFLFCF